MWIGTGDAVGAWCRRGRVGRGRCGVWTGRHGRPWCGRCEGVWKHGDGRWRGLGFSGDRGGVESGLGNGEADIVFGGEDRPEEGDEVVVGDLGEGVVVDDGARVGVAGVDDPCGGHAEAGPDFAVFCADADCLEGVAEAECVGAAAEGGDEHGLDVAGCGGGGGELGEEGEDMGSRAAARGGDGLCAGHGSGAGVGGDGEGVGEEDGAGRDDAEGGRGDGDGGEGVPAQTSHEGPDWVLSI